MPAALPGDGNSSSRTDGAAAEQRACLLGRQVVLGLDPDRLGVADHDRHAHARRLDRQLGQLHDLLRLGAELRLLVELLAVEVPVHAQVVLGLRLVAKALHRLRACARDRLVGRDAHAREAGRVVQRLEHARERDRAAVRVGDDAVVLERARAVHLGHDERDARLEPVGGRLVDRDGAAATACGTSSRDAPVPTEKRKTSTSPRDERLGRRLLDRPAAELLAGRPRRGEHAHVLVAARAQQLERDRADRAGRPDDADARAGQPSTRASRTPGSDRGRPAPRARPRRRGSRTRRGSTTSR